MCGNSDIPDHLTIVGVAIERDGVVYSLPAPNRHHHVIRLMVNEGVPLPVTKDAIQGFITNTGEFLDRKEAYKVVIENGQNVVELHHDYDLFSEDVW